MKKYQYFNKTITDNYYVDIIILNMLDRSYEKIFVTGASSFIGSHLVERLLELDTR